MDSLITAAAQALASGDPLGALKRVALREDPPALALRGIAMAQLGDFGRARILIRRAARTFGPTEAVARARCVVAEAEIALASRDLRWPTEMLEAARETLEVNGDRLNAAHAGYLQIRRLLLIGQVDEAERKLALLDLTPHSPQLRASHELISAGIATRRLQTGRVRSALERAYVAASHAQIPSLLAEVDSAVHALNTPAARLIERGREQSLLLEDVEALLASAALVVDTWHSVVRDSVTSVSLAGRPVLLALARTLGEAWPGDTSRDLLLARAFGAKRADESHRARLRVEIGRLRSILRPVSAVSASKRGFILLPSRAVRVVVLAPPGEEDHPAVLALLSDGEPWSSSALALALGTSQRTVQRALDSLADAKKVQSLGRGRTRRWMIPVVPSFATSLLLPTRLQFD